MRAEQWGRMPPRAWRSRMTLPCGSGASLKRRTLAPSWPVRRPRAAAAARPSFRASLRAHAQSMSDEALAAYCNLSSDKNVDDNNAMLRDMDLVMRDAMSRMAKTMG